MNGKHIYSVQAQIKTKEQAVSFAKLNLDFADDIVYFQAEQVWVQ
jgi:hypothetical protein